MRYKQFDKQLTSIESVKSSGRTMSIHVDDEKIQSFIIEAQEQDIKNAIGDNLYVDLLRYVNRGEDVAANEYYDNLLEGTIYDVNKESFIFQGLVQALNYFVYARLVKHSDGNLTQFGWTLKESEHSSRPDLKQKQEEYKDAFLVAESMMNDVLRYLKHHIDKFPKWKKQNIRPRRGVIITKIGD